MRTANRFVLVLITAPDLKTARRLVRGALAERLVACANLLPRLESHYWWQGQLEKGSEVLLMLKTVRSKLGALETLVVANHPYDTPEFIVLPLAGGNKRYLDWLNRSVA